MRFWIVVIALLLVGVPVVAWLDQEIDTRSPTTVVVGGGRGDHFRSSQLVRCDEETLIADATHSRDDPIGGTIGCAAGDFTGSLDCRGMTVMTASFYDYGDGAAEAIIWSCIQSPGFDDNPGDTSSLAPVTGPTGASPEPLCTNVNAGAGITLDGVAGGIQEFSVDGVAWNFLVGEIQSCTTNCNVTLRISCSR